jgi:hypothetical protein
LSSHAELQDALDRCGSVAAAARDLGIPRTTLRNRLVTAPSGFRRHMVIPDTQCKPGVPLEHLSWAGQYAAEKRPEVIIFIGDHADMPSLSSYDKGKKSFEGRRYKADIEAAKRGMSLFLDPITAVEGYFPRLVMTLGNHENRINRAVEDEPHLDGLLSVDDLLYKESGFEVYPYLAPVVIDGVAYCHFFTSGVMGRPVSSAKALNTKKHQSCVMGHVQRREIDYQYNATGKRITSIFCGAFYQHDEDYLTPQGNAETWRGVWVLNQVRDGEYDEMPVSLDYLKRRYG